MKRLRIIKQHLKKRKIEVNIKHNNRIYIKQTTFDYRTTTTTRQTRSPRQQTKTNKTKQIKTTQNKKEKEEKYDIIIVGGALNGGVMAQTLATSPYSSELRIAIVDPKPPPTKMPEKMGLRTVALVPSSIQLLKNIGIYDKIKEKTNVFYDMKVWDGNTILDSKITQVTFEEPEGMGVIVDNQVLETAIAMENKCERIQGIVKGIEENEKEAGKIIIIGEGEKERRIKTSLIIAADGPTSPIRTMLQVPYTSTMYDQRAFVCTVRTKEPSTTAYQKFLKNGPIALLPTSTNTSNVIWSTKAEHARELERITEDELVKTINEHLTKRKENRGTQDIISEGITWAARQISNTSEEEIQIPEVIEILPSKPVNRGSFPLSQLHIESYAYPNIAFIGDAAHCVHPFAGQGVNLGFADAVTLTRAVQYGLKHGLDIGSPLVLKTHYHDIQYTANAATMASLHHLQTFFLEEAPITSFVRGIGMAAFERCFPIKALVHDTASYKMTLESIGGVQNTL